MKRQYQQNSDVLTQPMTGPQEPFCELSQPDQRHADGTALEDIPQPFGSLSVGVALTGSSPVHPGQVRFHLHFLHESFLFSGPV